MTKTDIAAICCFVMITYLSVSPLPELPRYTGGDKLHHIVAYMTFAGLALFSRQTLRHKIVFAVLIAMYGGAIELIQPYVNRYGEFSDFAANAAGVVLGFSAVQIVTGLQKRKRSSGW